MKLLYQDSAYITGSAILAAGSTLGPYIQHFNDTVKQGSYKYPESSINLPFDEEGIRRVIEVKTQKVTSKLKYILVIGIGGANLGSKAIYDALYGGFDELQPERLPKMIFLDTLKGDFLALLKDFFTKHVFRPEEVLVNVISKSGDTPETRFNFEFILKHFANWKDRLVITTGQNSFFHKFAGENDIPVLLVPQKVGDRYGVFSAEGLFPLAACGFELLELLEGAMEVKSRCLQKDILNNPAALWAAITFFHYTKGRDVNNTFFFNPYLESLGKWKRQLLAESLGKGGRGIIPLVSMGTVDLHSQLQLFLSGPDRFFTEFVRVGSAAKDINIEGGGVSAHGLTELILEGVKKSYIKNSRPFVEILFYDLSLKSLGRFMQMQMIGTMYLASLMNVNAFNQPAVEDYKKEARKALG